MTNVAVSSSPSYLVWNPLTFENNGRSCLAQDGFHWALKPCLRLFMISGPHCQGHSLLWSARTSTAPELWPLIVISLNDTVCGWIWRRQESCCLICLWLDPVWIRPCVFWVHFPDCGLKQVALKCWLVPLTVKLVAKPFRDSDIELIGFSHLPGSWPSGFQGLLF